MAKRKIYTICGVTGNLKQIAEEFRISYGTLVSKLNKGMTIEEAVDKAISDEFSHQNKPKLYTLNGFTGT